jgi:hypothetical protein
MAADLPDRIRLPFAFDPARLAQDLERVSGEAWTNHVVRQNYDGAWTVLPLPAPAGETHPIRMIYPDPAATAFVDTPFLDRTLYIRDVLACFLCPLRVVRLMRLAAGSVIKAHEDEGLELAAGSARIHIPIATSPEVEFLLNGTPVAMAPGEAWYLRLSDPHQVANRGPHDRVHLVVDLEANDWLLEKLREGAEGGPPPSVEVRP